MPGRKCKSTGGGGRTRADASTERTATRKNAGMPQRCAPQKEEPRSLTALLHKLAVTRGADKDVSNGKFVKMLNYLASIEERLNDKTPSDEAAE